MNNIRASQRARTRVSRCRNSVRVAEDDYVDNHSGLFTPTDGFLSVPQEIKAKTIALADVPDEDDITPRVENVIYDVDGDAVGSFARVGQETFVTAHHVIESLAFGQPQMMCGEAKSGFLAQFGDGEDHFCVVLHENKTSDWAHVYCSAPLKGPILEMAPFVPDATVEIPYARNGSKVVYSAALSPIEDVYGYATIHNTPFVPGTSGMPVLHHGRLVGIFVGKQRENGIVSLVNPEHDSLAAISSAIGDIDLYGKKKLSRFVRSGKISSADYAEKVRGLTLRFGRPPTSYEIRQEVDYHYMYEQDAYTDDEEEEEEYYDTYYNEDQSFGRYLNPYDDPDFGADEGRFSDNDDADYEREKRHNMLTGQRTLHFDGYGKKKKVAFEEAPKMIVRPQTQFEVIPPVTQLDSYNPFDDVEAVNPFDDVEAVKEALSAKVETNNPFDVVMPTPPPVRFTSPVEAFGYTGGGKTRTQKNELLTEMAPQVVKMKLDGYANAVKTGNVAEMLNNLPTTAEMSKARMAAEVAALKREIKILNDQGIVAMDPVVLTSHEIEKYPASEHEKQQLNKELKVLRSIKGVRERKEAEREVQQRRALRIQEAMNIKTRELAEMKAQLEKLQASTSGRKNF